MGEDLFEPLPKCGDQYRHFKGGIYAVSNVVSNATNGREGEYMVLYSRVEPYSDKMYVRELGEFQGLTRDGAKRFTRV